VQWGRKCTVGANKMCKDTAEVDGHGFLGICTSEWWPGEWGASPPVGELVRPRGSRLSRGVKDQRAVGLKFWTSPSCSLPVPPGQHSRCDGRVYSHLATTIVSRPG